MNIRPALAGALLLACLSAADTIAADERLEATLMAEAELIENRLLASPRRYPDDDPLVVYINELLCRAAAERCPELRLHVLRSPEANAFMLPNGGTAMFSGLLLRFDDETQLMAVLAHEVAHYQYGHSLQRWKEVKATSNVALAISMAAGATGELIAGALAELGLIAGLFAYTREQEREADLFAARRMAELGYPVAGKARLWQSLHAEEQARRRGSLGVFTTHPPTSERLRSAEAAAREQMQSGAVAAPVFQGDYLASIAPHRSDWLADEIGRRSPNDGSVLLTRLQDLPLGQGEVTYFHGELLRRSPHREDRERAFELLLAAVEQDDVPVTAWRSLGQSARALGHVDRAREAFTRYLELVPDAPERLLLEPGLR